MTVDTRFDEVALLVDSATVVAEQLACSENQERRRWLREIADVLDARAEDLVQLAARETHLGVPRLEGELRRTTGQPRYLGDVIEDGGCFEAAIDEASLDRAGNPVADVRKVLVPVGPVAVFTASNFPFAFSVAGGDSASAIAAGCPVVVKAHPGHPNLSATVAEIVRDAIAQCGGPPDALSVVYGLAAGTDLVRDERIRAASFTGSLEAGMALASIIAQRTRPIPFFAEMGSLNPCLVSREKASQDGAQVAAGFVASFSQSAGQLCTKPGILFVPRGHALLPELSSQVSEAGRATMLNASIAERYAHARAHVIASEGVRVLVEGEVAGLEVTPTLVATDSQTLLASPDVLLCECFGPLSIVVEYDDYQEYADLVMALGGMLTTAIHATDGEVEAFRELIPTLSKYSGRVLWNCWPTGLTVSWATNHTGPYPATTIDHTSVGAASITRFLRPVAFQGFPNSILPPQLRSENPWRISRRLNGAQTAAFSKRTVAG